MVEQPGHFALRKGPGTAWGFGTPFAVVGSHSVRTVAAAAAAVGKGYHY